MPINKAEQSLENRLIQEINDLKRQIRDFKTAQPIGSDVLDVIAVPSTGSVDSGTPAGTPITVVPTAGLTFTVTITPVNNALTQWNVLSTLYVDGTTSADIFPNGANITGTSRRVTKMDWIDWALSSDVSNSRVFVHRAVNNDSSNHSYMFRNRYYVPKVAGQA